LTETGDADGEKSGADEQNTQITLDRSLRAAANPRFRCGHVLNFHVIGFIGAHRRFANLCCSPNLEVLMRDAAHVAVVT